MKSVSKRQLIVIAHNLRSTHNIGSLLRTAEGLAVTEVIFSGYTPYPLMQTDPRLPHIAVKVNKQIVKTALGAEILQSWRQADDISAVIHELHGRGFVIAALEQTAGSISLPDFQPPDKLAVILGREAEGLEGVVIDMCDIALEIPMLGGKESFNVVQAAAMTLYHCRYRP